jgi:hypothetical protein
MALKKKIKSYDEAKAIIEGREYIPPTEPVEATKPKPKDPNWKLPWAEYRECKRLLAELGLPSSTPYARAQQIRSQRKVEERQRLLLNKELGLDPATSLSRAREVKLMRDSEAKQQREKLRKEKEENYRRQLVERLGLDPSTTLLDAKKADSIRRNETRRQGLVQELSLPENTTLQAAENIKDKLDRERAAEAKLRRLKATQEAQRRRLEEAAEAQRRRRAELPYLCEVEDCLEDWRRSAIRHNTSFSKLADKRRELALMEKPTKLSLKDLYLYLELHDSTRPSPEYAGEYMDRRQTKASISRQEKWQVQSEKLKRLIKEREEAYLEEAAAKDRLASIVKIDADADIALATALTVAARQATESCIGFLYLKVWAHNDGTRWYKVGITNDPARRDVEQNVLPVPAATVKLAQLPSMEHARAVEQAIHGVLNDAGLRIRDANNRELFDLTDPQLAALIGVMEQMEEGGC